MIGVAEVHQFLTTTFGIDAEIRKQCPNSGPGFFACGPTVSHIGIGTYYSIE